eukprot:3132754-Rhodomonas_salina.3
MVAIISFSFLGTGPLTCYARAMPCLVLTSRMVLPGIDGAGCDSKLLMRRVHRFLSLSVASFLKVRPGAGRSP